MTTLTILSHAVDAVVILPPAPGIWILSTPACVGNQLAVAKFEDIQAVTINQHITRYFFMCDTIYYTKYTHDIIFCQKLRT